MCLLSAVGVSANIEGIGLEELGIKTEKGKVMVDKFYQTNVPRHIMQLVIVHHGRLLLTLQVKKELFVLRILVSMKRNIIISLSQSIIIMFRVVLIAILKLHLLVILKSKRKMQVMKLKSASFLKCKW